MIDIDKMKHSNRQERQNCLELLDWLSDNPEVTGVFNPTQPWQVVLTINERVFSAYPHIKRVVDHSNYKSTDVLAWDEIKEFM